MEYCRIAKEIEADIALFPEMWRKDNAKMRLRPYISNRDLEYLKKWETDERTHALWCANLIPYPFSEEELYDVLKKNENDWGDSAYTFTEDDGQPIGFFTYSVNVNDNSGFLKFVVIDNELRGKGYGTKMLILALDYAYMITGVSSVQLNVFDINADAKKCYQKAGFIERNIVSKAFTYKNETWGRCNMVAEKDIERMIEERYDFTRPEKKKIKN